MNYGVSLVVALYKDVIDSYVFPKKNLLFNKLFQKKKKKNTINASESGILSLDAKSLFQNP
jgi:hypothetical protein